MNEKKDRKKKINLKEMWKEPKGRAKIELSLYGVFFVFVIIFVRVLSAGESQITSSNDDIMSEVKKITDNYAYNIEIDKNNMITRYYGNELGHNKTIYKDYQDIIVNYYKKGDNYYIQENGNYLLTSQSEVYNIMSKKYLDINYIKEYLRISTKEDNIYKVKIKDLILDSQSEEIVPITITVSEDQVTIFIDYTRLIQIEDSEVEKLTVKINYSRINKITTLEE